jgi:hypothetical protein
LGDTACRACNHDGFVRKLCHYVSFVLIWAVKTSS